MQLKFVFLFIVLVFARAQEQEQEEECGEEKAGECVGKLLLAVLGDTSEEEVCSELRDVTNCLREVADECLGEERDAEIDEGLQELNNLIAENCPAVEEVDDALKECVEKIEDELLECLGEGVSQALGAILDDSGESETDEDAVKCLMYNTVTNCVTQQIRESCGIETSKRTLDAMMEVPSDIRASCGEPATKDLLQSLFDKRKKK
ncbi:DUF19 domain-containing protein [Nephila pilipes]|uniref:DUF19 domain-containing protein n=1 Tax=Nephila pilipes TaxID=299642 RepID=A0A8X6U6V3_NEPPI|nr:DUF19 domain-containing protein [Nephila pilipes]